MNTKYNMVSDKELEEKRQKAINDEEIKQEWYKNYLRDCEEKGVPIQAIAVPDVDKCIEDLSTEKQEADIKGRKEAEEKKAKEEKFMVEEKAKQARKKQLEAEKQEKKEIKK